MHTAFCSYHDSTSVSGRSLTVQPKASASASATRHGAVGVVALAHVQNARDAADLAEIQVVEAVFAAGQGQDQRVHGRLFDELRVVIAPGVRAVAAAHQKDVLDRAAFDRRR